MPFDDPAIGVLVLGGGGGPPPTGDETPPAAPTGLVATPGNTTVALGWSDNSEPDLDRYRVYQATVSGGPYTLIATVTVSEYTATALVNGTTYFFVVTAVDDFGYESVNSIQVSAVPAAPPGGDVTPPPVPTGLTATPGDRQVTLNWDNSPASDFASFKVYRAATSTGTYTLIATRTVSDYVDTGLTNDTTYYYKVSAVDTSGNESAQSGFVPGTPAAVPGDTVAPAVPTGLTATASDRAVVLDWNNNTEPDLSNYRVYRSLTSSGSYTYIATRTVSDHVDGTLTNGTTYYYKVSAVDVSGNESGQTSSVSATPVAPPPPPGGDDGYPTYADRQATINVGDNFNTVIAAFTPGTLFGVASGTHNIDTEAKRFTPRVGDRFVGVVDSNDVPLSNIRGNWDGTQFGGGITSPFTGTLPPDVQMLRLNFSYFSPADQQSALNMGTDWTYWKCWGHHCRVAAFRLGAGGLIANGKAYDNGNSGMFNHTSPNGGIVDGMELYNNNLQGWNDSAVEAGGLKFALDDPDDVTVRNCYAHNNNGPGIWFDSAGQNNIIEDCLCENNTRPGIMYEISQGPAYIRRNICGNNSGAGDIYVPNSRGFSGQPIIVEDNLCDSTAGHAGIWMEDATTRPVRLGYVTVRRNSIYRAVVSGLSNVTVGQFPDNGLPPGIVINENHYYTDISNAWQWRGARYTFSGWQGLGFDTIGTLSGYTNP